MNLLLFEIGRGPTLEILSSVSLRRHCHAEHIATCLCCPMENTGSSCCAVPLCLTLQFRFHYSLQVISWSIRQYFLSSMYSIYQIFLQYYLYDRNCERNYIDYHRCRKLKGEDYENCNYFKKVYSARCPQHLVCALCHLQCCSTICLSSFLSFNFLVTHLHWMVEKFGG